MVILDTNVLSELTRSIPNENVVKWVSSQDAERIYTTAITTAEIEYGLEGMDDGKRRNLLRAKYDWFFGTKLTGKILPFDAVCSQIFARIGWTARLRGEKKQTADLMVAAIGLYHGFAIATRDVDDFHHDDLVVINPWKA